MRTEADGDEEEEQVATDVDDGVEHEAHGEPSTSGSAEETTTRTYRYGHVRLHAIPDLPGLWVQDPTTATRGDTTVAPRQRIRHGLSGRRPADGAQPDA